MAAKQDNRRLVEEPAFVTSSFELRDGKIDRTTEYWLDCEAEVAEWRSDLLQRFDPEL